jgi:hypothetical protein
MRKNAKILRELRALAPAHIDPKSGELNMTMTITISLLRWTLILGGVFLIGLAAGAWVWLPGRRRPARRPARVTEETLVDTLDGTETIEELLARCRQKVD